MILESLELINFRNYESLSIRFDDRTNIIYGKNAQGKTNILEAAYVSGTTRSHKGQRDRDMIRFGTQEAHIKALVRRQNSHQTIDIHLKKGRKKGIAINRVPVKRASDLLGILHIIFFSPQDLNMITDEPQLRRSFLDSQLCQLDRIYLSDLNRYNRVLNERSRLLKDLYDHPDLRDTLDVWDSQLVEYGSRIIDRRRQFLDELHPLVKEMHYAISGGREELEMKYDANTTSEEFEASLKKSRQRDERLGQNTVGPHRDNISFSINGADVRKFGSQGQQRTCALSLKLSEISLVEKRIHDTPVLLLDDVLSELDSTRQNLLLDNLRSTQTIITCTGLDEFINNRFTIDRLFEVNEGRIVERDNTSNSKGF